MFTQVKNVVHDLSSMFISSQKLFKGVVAHIQNELLVLMASKKACVFFQEKKRK